VEVFNWGEAKGALAEFSGREDLRREVWVGEVEGLAGLDLFCGLYKGCPVVVLGGQPPGKKDFDVAAGSGAVVLCRKTGAGGVESCGQDAGVVEDKEIAGLQQLRKISEEMVGEPTRLAVEREHTAGAADRWRVLGNEVFGEIVVEFGDKHKQTVKIMGWWTWLRLRQAPAGGRRGRRACVRATRR